METIPEPEGIINETPFPAYLQGMETQAFNGVHLQGVARSQPTYKEWKLANSFACFRSCWGFPAYLQGMETE